METLKGLADASHKVRVTIIIQLQFLLTISLQCIMITGDSPLTIVHVAKDAEFIDRNALVLDLKENLKYEVGKLMYCDVILHTLILYL